MEMPDPLVVIADIADDVAILNLGVIDVVQNFHARRVNALHDVHSPGDVVEHVVRVVDLAVQILHADVDALVFRVSLHLIQEGDAVIRALGIGLAFARAGK